MFKPEKEFKTFEELFQEGFRPHDLDPKAVVKVEKDGKKVIYRKKELYQRIK